MTDEDEPTTDARPVPLDEDDGPREGPEYAFDPKAGW
jgi:hypothetical protein